MERRTEPVETLDNERWLSFSFARGDTLLPGIPIEVTMAQIVPKLSWKDFYILSSVSPAWCNAIRSRRVYNARVRSCSTDTLVLVRYVQSAEDLYNGLLLYSMKDDSCYELPPMPPLPPSSILVYKYWSTYVSMDGKVYIMEKWTEFDRVVGISPSFNRVWVLDVAGKRQWQQCANMPISKISRERFLHGGHAFLGDNDYGFKPPTNYLEVYHPTKDQWTAVKHLQRQLGEDKNEIVFMTERKFYSLRDEDMHVYDFESRVWTYLQSFSFAKIGPVHYRTVVPVAVLAYNDELVAIACVCNGKERKCIIIRSEGLRAKKIDIRWREALTPYKISPWCFRGGDAACMAAVYL
ncbi:unnamed protein product [Calypogeia fissa]